MAKIYTSGLTVSENILLTKTRRLPINGRLFVKPGDTVAASDIVAEAEIQGILGTVKAASQLGIAPDALQKALKTACGDTVSKGDLLASHSAFFGLLKSECRSPYEGTLEMISPITGSLGIRLPGTKISLRAYLPGVVKETGGNDTVVIESRAALIQGIFGIGGEGSGVIRLLVDSPDKEARPEDITGDHKGCLLTVGASISLEVIRKAIAVGATGIIGGAMPDTNIKALLGRDIGVAITGEENIPLSIILTEGFGSIPISDRTFRILQKAENKPTSFNGTTHIRAGVIRPEVVTAPVGSGQNTEHDYDLRPGRAVRITSRPWFCRTGIIEEIPEKPEAIETGAVVRVIRVRLEDGTLVSIPKSNAEITD